MDKRAELKELDVRLFALLEGVWSEEEKEEARSFYHVGEPGLTTYCAFMALRKRNIPIPQPLAGDVYETLDFAGLEGDPYYEALQN
ncbi:MAG: hypothetical protein Q4G38_02600 [Aeriscardovia aeriphila]|nr:hypothetical protein [Aeriscardovia aeriphila]